MSSVLKIGGFYEKKRCKAQKRRIGSLEFLSGGIAPFVISAVQIYEIVLSADPNTSFYEGERGAIDFGTSIIIGCVVAQPFFIFSFYRLSDIENRYANILLIVMFAGVLGVLQYIAVAMHSTWGLMAAGVTP